MRPAARLYCQTGTALVNALHAAELRWIVVEEPVVLPMAKAPPDIKRTAAPRAKVDNIFILHLVVVSFEIAALFI